MYSVSLLGDFVLSPSSFISPHFGDETEFADDASSLHDDKTKFISDKAYIYPYKPKPSIAMPQKNTQAKVLSPARLEQAKKGLSSLANLSDYKPQRAEYGPNNLATVSKNLQDAFNAENTAKDAYDKARDAHVAAQWAAWNFYQGAGESVIGQYGSSSDEYASLGYKKKTEYKKTARGTKAAKAAAAKSKGSDS